MTEHDRPRYDKSMINWLRVPDTQGEAGDWTSTWSLTVTFVPEQAELRRLSTELADLEGVHDAAFTATGEDGLRMDLRTVHRPVDEEAYLLVDRVLIRVDEAVQGIVEINGSQRDLWRTFRQQR
ncbi:MAG TPA: hypothetical protein VNA14_11330 [Mycobacteriales bacterium]|nr:hypothetical protein [Mycobacteriales bacterium]